MGATATRDRLRSTVTLVLVTCLSSLLLSSLPVTAQGKAKGDEFRSDASGERALASLNVSARSTRKVRVPVARGREVDAHSTHPLRVVTFHDVSPAADAHPSLIFSTHPVGSPPFTFTFKSPWMLSPPSAPYIASSSRRSPLHRPPCVADGVGVK